MISGHSILYISKFRTEIMGYAILGVMVAHIKTICEFPDTYLNKLLGVLVYSVFTGGFIFLSGLGLYSSYSNNSNTKEFYIKRIKRLLIPYWLISMPYFIYTDLLIGGGIFPFVEHILTISFWFHGNYSGMWYISASVLLYVLYPFFHRIIYNNSYDSYFNCIIMMIIMLFIMILLKRFAFSFYGMTNIALNNIPLFIIGSYVMSWIVSGRDTFSIVDLIKIVIMGGLLLCFDDGFWGVINIISIWLLGIFFCYLTTKQSMSCLLKMFRWLGRYSLELYVIHLLIYYFLNHFIGIFNQGLHIVIGVVAALILCSPFQKMTRKLVNLI